MKFITLRAGFKVVLQVISPTKDGKGPYTLGTQEMLVFYNKKYQWGKFYLKVSKEIIWII